MKVYIVTFHHSNTGTSGHCVYYHNLALLMIRWGWEVRSLSKHVPAPYDCEGVQVCTLNEHLTNQLWCDIIITHPQPHLLCKVKKRTVIVKHNTGHDPYRFDNCKIIYCGRAAAEVTQMICFESIVWHPGNRFYRTEKGGDINGHWIMVNCNENKGGHLLIQLAEQMPHVQFAGILGGYGPQITKPLPNLEYWPCAGDIGAYYQKAKGLLCLSQSEGFPTVVMEAMSHGLPIVGNSDCAGFMEVVGNCGFVAKGVDGWHAGINLVSQESLYPEYAEASLSRAAEIEESRDHEALKRFLIGE